MRTILNNSSEKLLTLEEELNAAKLYVEKENLTFKEQIELILEVDSEIEKEKTLFPFILI